MLEPREETIAAYRAVFPASTIYGFEPFEASFQILTARFESDKKILILPSAIADGEEKEAVFC